MKKIATRTAMFVALAALVGASAAHAQITERMQFKTAFPFTVGKHDISGRQLYRQASRRHDLNVLELTDGSTTTLITVEPELPASISR